MYEYFVHHQPAKIIENGYHDIIIENVVFNERIGQGVHIYNLLKKTTFLEKVGPKVFILPGMLFNHKNNI
jgi:hypothetical protein